MRNSNDTIKHIATIVSRDGNLLHVRMLQSSACSGCHAAGLCKSSESKEKEVDVVTPNAEQYKEGQQVMLIGSINQGLKATWWAYVLPIIILVITLVTTTKLGYNEIIASLLSLGSLALYFIVLYLLRDKFTSKFSFSVHPLGQE